MKRFLIFICALFMCGAVNAATLNIKHNNITKQITLDTKKRTAPALAMRVGNKTYYADLIETTTRNANNIYVAYNNKTYMVRDNKEYAFFITTTGATTSFDFTMSAAGTFYVDWGDGTTQEIVRTNTSKTTYSHNYAAAGEYQIRFDGSATGYNSYDTNAAISFYNNKNVAKIDGSLGAIFPTIKNGTTTFDQPRFFDTFKWTNLGGKIPEKLFDGIYGAPTSAMFCGTFYGTAIEGNIPENLFSSIYGQPKNGSYGSFESTFSNCQNLTGTIPEKLFAGIKGIPTNRLFAWTFNHCSGLTGSIPAKLFNGISGTPADNMYNGTFTYCTGLTGTIPDGLFGNLYGAPATQMFAWTFDGTAQLTGPTARTANGTRLYDVEYNGVKWQNSGVNAFRDMYTGTNIHD